MMTVHMWAAAFVVSSLVGTSGFIQQPPWGFSVLGKNEQPRMIAKLMESPYKPGIEPSVFWNLQSTTGLRDQNGQVISAFGFYGWTEGTTTRVAVIARLPPEGAENRFYSVPELFKNGLKPRLELIATYTLKSGEIRVIEELKAIGAEPAFLRIETEQPK